MNRPLFIIIGSVVILILLLVWVYVLFIRDNFTGDNNTGSSGTFTNLDPGDTSLDPNSFDSNQPNDDFISTTTDTGERKKLRQLTTKPVVGFSEINASTSDVAYFIEAGVGHIYEVDIFSGQERRISATTFPDTYAGDVSSNGKYFVIQTGYSNSRKTHVGTIETESQAASFKELSEGVISFKFLEENVLGYAVIGAQSITVSAYNLKTNESKKLFTIPFREASIVWGDSVDGTHYFFPKPAEGLGGFVYEYRDGAVKRLPLDGFNLSAYGSDDVAIASYQNDSKYQTVSYNQTEKTITSFNSKFVPSKCLYTRDLILICGVDKTINMDESQVTQWQKGLVQFIDDINMVNLETGTLTELINTSETTGRVADITKLEQGVKYDYIYFINKNDRTLWIYEYEHPMEDSDQIE